MEVTWFAEGPRHHGTGGDSGEPGVHLLHHARRLVAQLARDQSQVDPGGAEPGGVRAAQVVRRDAALEGYRGELRSDGVILPAHRSILRRLLAEGARCPLTSVPQVPAHVGPLAEERARLVSHDGEHVIEQWAHPPHDRDLIIARVRLGAVDLHDAATHVDVLAERAAGFAQARAGGDEEGDVRPAVG